MTPLVEELIPCPDPWEVARKLAHLPHLLFLDSSERNSERGRYSYVMAEGYGGSWDDPIAPGTTDNRPRIDLIESMHQLHENHHLDELPPFQGGSVFLLAYELAQELERLPSNENDFHNKVCTAFIYKWLVAFDHREHRAWIVAPIIRYVDDVVSPFDRAKDQIEHVRSLLADRVAGLVNPPLGDTPRTGGLTRPATRLTKIADNVYSNFSREEYIATVQKCVDYIHAGDVFQVNLSQRLLAPLTEHPLDVYGRLRRVSPAPFSCYFDAGDFQVLSASPERFLKVSPGGEAVTQPIKGTRPRGKTPDEDAKLIRELLMSGKDRAENVMIVDLLRNDLGRVCEYGSVTVPRVCELESYSHVHHLVSEVRGQLRKDKTPFDLLRAAFPGGSVTGAPKVRAMEIIAELEPTARGPYCGSIGFVGFDGAMDTNILIRTFTACRGWLQFPVGGGIVADSDPEAEYEETLAKAQGLLRALR